MGLKYWRVGAVALSAVLILFTGAAGAVLAAEPLGSDVVFDGVVTVHWTDPDHGPMEGAVVRIFFYHDGDPIPGIVPLGAPMDANGIAVISGVPRAAEGSTALLLDIRGDLQTSTVDEAGCTRIEAWLAQTKAAPAGLAVDVALETESQSLQLNCPDETPTSTPPDDPTATPSGTVLGATGQPQITPPATDVSGGAATPAGSPFLPALLALVGLALILVPASTLAFARTGPASRRRRRGR